tara:strand:- start:372 stop:524 length:153 start_codon:yes stop_codon:yes gene_type:complete
MSDDDYHLGYYEGIRNCIQHFIQLQMQGCDIKDIVQGLVALREEAKELVE